MIDLDETIDNAVDTINNKTEETAEGIKERTTELTKNVSERFHEIFFPYGLITLIVVILFIVILYIRNKTEAKNLREDIEVRKKVEHGIDIGPPKKEKKD